MACSALGVYPIGGGRMIASPPDRVRLPAPTWRLNTGGLRSPIKVLLLMSCLAAFGCAEHVPEPVLVPQGVPHISWEIQRGTRDNADQDFVCHSDPRTECVIVVSGEKEDVFATVHVYYHPAATPTRYTGSVEMGFFDGATESHTFRPNLTLPPGGKPMGQTITDRVTKNPGVYEVRLEVVATSVDGGRSQNIRDQFNVTIK